MSGPGMGGGATRGEAIHLAPAASKELLAEKRSRLEGVLRGLGRTLVAYSGGVDSAYLLAEAHRVLGDQALGIIAQSPSLPASELEGALALAAEHRLPVRVVETNEMEREGYRQNNPDRCYYCKTELFEHLVALAGAEGWRAIAYGAVTDDLGDDRPGMGAARELEISAPLLEAGLAKLEVRALAYQMGLRVWDKPQSACLASRIPHGMEVTVDKLRQVESAEAWLRQKFGLRVVRVRHFGQRARVETETADIERLQAALPELRSGLMTWGFETVEIDPAGYRRPDPLPAVNTEVS